MRVLITFYILLTFLFSSCFSDSNGSCIKSGEPGCISSGDCCLSGDLCIDVGRYTICSSRYCIGDEKEGCVVDSDCCSKEYRCVFTEGGKHLCLLPCLTDSDCMGRGRCRNVQGERYCM